MNLTQARKILGITDADSTRTIKTKYHRLIAKYHPDVTGNASSLAYAQMINEAYRTMQTVKDSGSLSGNDIPSSYHQSENSKSRNRFQKFWHQDQTDDLIAEREIYVTHEIYGESYESHITTGKYLWDPDIEDFTLFLKSLNQLCASLLDHAYEKKYPHGDYSETTRLLHHQKLFHALAEHYMDPYECLQKLNDPIKIDEDGRCIFRFHSHLGAKKSDTHYANLLSLHAMENIYPKALKNNRLLVRTADERFLGHLSLEKDVYYLCLIPLLRSRKCQIRMQVSNDPISCRQRLLNVTVDVNLDIRITAASLSKNILTEAEHIKKLLASL